MNGKGDRPRPLTVSREEFARRWVGTFYGDEVLPTRTIDVAEREPIEICDHLGRVLSVRRQIGFKP